LAVFCLISGDAHASREEYMDVKGKTCSSLPLETIALGLKESEDDDAKEAIEVGLNAPNISTRSAKGCDVRSSENIRLIEMYRKLAAELCDGNVCGVATNLRLGRLHPEF